MVTKSLIMHTLMCIVIGIDHVEIGHVEIGCRVEIDLAIELAIDQAAEHSTGRNWA